MDREKVIKGLYACTTLSENGVTDGDCKICPYDKGYATGECWLQMNRDALELLKEQEEREQRICKSICNFIRGACSTDTDDDKDFVCYEIQKCFTEGR